MWIWIGIGIALWLTLGICSCRMLYNVSQQSWSSGWDGFCWFWACYGFFLPPASILTMLICNRKDCFSKKKGTKMKIHWNEEEQQIMSKNGACRYDPRALGCRLDTLESRLAEAERVSKRWHDYSEEIKADNEEIDKKNATSDESEARVIAQLQCSAKGHKMVYKEKEFNNQHRWFIFKCSSCGLEITKTKAELKPTEKEALKKLKLL